ncbi:DUF357 domain-containing protein [archaeon SCG-AAA382B04]|nr:DUF357 domain-containing protein [archaeon SCG-AAA382B04]
MMEELEQETEKWQKKLKKKEPKFSPKIQDGEDFVENIKAYLEDSYHFREEDDYVRAFESIIWAWAWFEIGRDYGFIDVD